MNTRYHLSYADKPYVQAIRESQSPYQDQTIAKGLAGLLPIGTTMIECTKEKCDLCATNGWSLYTDYQEGQYVLETQGCYSDYGVGRLLLVLKSFNRSTVYSVDEAITQGLMQSIQHKEWWFDD